MARCPHDDIRFCPLYHAAHEGWGLGCDDGKLGSGKCAVARGLSYIGAVKKIRKQHPGYVERIEKAMFDEESERQRRRNMRHAAVH